MTFPTDDVRWVIIIGSGPRSTPPRAQPSPLVFEGAVTAGGALMNATEVENFPGFREEGIRARL